MSGNTTAVAVLTCGAVMGCAGMLAQEGSVTRTYDEFEQQNVTKLDGMYIEAGASSLVGVTIINVNGSPSAMMKTETYSEHGWKYLKCPQLDFVADGEPVKIGEAQHDGTVRRGGSVKEYLTVEIAEDELRRMAQATSVKMRLCNNVVTWSPGNIRKLREFISVAW